MKSKHKIKKHLNSYSTVPWTVTQQCTSWHIGAGMEWTGKESYWLEEGEGVGDGQRVVSSSRWRARCNGTHTWPSCTILCSGPVPQKLHSASSNRTHLRDWTVCNFESSHFKGFMCRALTVFLWASFFPLVGFCNVERLTYVPSLDSYTVYQASCQVALSLNSGPILSQWLFSKSLSHL